MTAPVQESPRTASVVDIEVFSDVVCPWCYVGRRRLERAAELLAGKYEIRVTWKPYQLNPWIPARGHGPRRVPADQVRQRRALVGDGWAPARGRPGRGDRPGVREDRPDPNTLQAHRLIWLAGQKGRQIEMVDALFQAYFTDGKDIGRDDVLTEIAARPASTPTRSARFLASDEGLAEVEEEEQVGRSLGIDGVPFFLLADKYGVSGAQPAEMLVNVIERVVELEAKEKRTLIPVGVPAEGAACSVDDPENCS